MNEQLVKDLARKAGLIAPYGSDREGLRDFDYRMFAELIVREMCDVFDNRAEPGTGFYEPHEPVELIKQHFGVEGIE
jgi:hypothetical protein